MVDPPREFTLDPESMRLWNAASEQEQLRTITSVADLLEADAADPSTPDNGDIELVESSVDSDKPGARKMGQSWNVTAMRKVAALLKKWGWTVLESPGFENRGTSSELHGDYIGCHHTGGAIDNDRILRDGRSDLSGPLCNFALHADGTVVLMAAGTANHFGVATISNHAAWGIEATGPIPLSRKGKAAFPNYRAYVALVVAIRMVEGWGVDRIKGHKEVARPDGRKPDPAFEESGHAGDGYPAPYPEMDRFRADCNVHEVLRNPTPPPAPAPAPKPPVVPVPMIGDEMVPMVRVLAPSSAQRMYFPATGLIVGIANQTELAALNAISLAAAGLKPTDKLPTVTITKEQMDALLVFQTRTQQGDDGSIVAAINELKPHEDPAPVTDPPVDPAPPTS